MMVQQEAQPVARYFTTVSACSCQGWRWRHRCRHVDELRKAREIIEANEAKWEDRDTEK